VFPLLVSWGLSLAHNERLFEKKYSPIIKVSQQVIALFQYYKSSPSTKVYQNAHSFVHLNPSPGCSLMGLVKAGKDMWSQFLLVYNPNTLLSKGELTLDQGPTIWRVLCSPCSSKASFSQGVIDCHIYGDSKLCIGWMNNST
jgi:hypothetical protein